MEKGKKIKTVFVIAIILIMSYGNLEEIQMNDNETSLIEPKQADVLISQVGQLDIRSAIDVFVSGNYAYVAEGYDGYCVGIINITDPTNPIKVCHIDIRAGGIYVTGNYLYVTKSYGGLSVIDISDPTNPTIVGEFDGNTERSCGIYVSESYAYVAEYNGGLSIIDISDPTNPTLSGYFYDGGNAMGVHVIGDYAYVADCYDGLKIIDISDPTTPVKVGQYDDGGSVRGVFVEGNYAYVADWDDGLVIIDISDPTAPAKVGRYDYGISALDVYVSGLYAYVVDYNDGLEIIDISDPTAPAKVGQFHGGGAAAKGVFVSESYVYMIDISGLEILQVNELENIITITSPINLSSWEIGFSYLIRWESTGYISKVNIELYKDGIFEMIIASDISNQGSYHWIIPLYLNNSTNYQIKVINVFNSSMYDYSDNFEIVPKLIIISIPDSFTSWEIGFSYLIRWESTGYISKVNIELFRDEIFEITIALDSLNDGSYYWTIPMELDNSTNYQIKITDTSDSSVYDVSEYFEIVSKLITISTPDSSSIWKTDSSHYIYWESTGYISTVNIELYKDENFELIITSDVSNDGSYYWTIPMDVVYSKNYQIIVIDTLDDSVYGISEYFEIYNNSITITTPDSLSTWKNNSSHYICWNSTGYIYTVNIELYRYNILEMYIASGVSNNGSYYWTIPIDSVYSENYQIKIIDVSDSSVYDVSEYFEISNIEEEPLEDEPSNPITYIGWSLVIGFVIVSIVSVIIKKKMKITNG